MSKTISKSIYCQRDHLRNKLSLKSLCSLYFALIHPHLLYCNNIINCISEKTFKTNFQIAKKAIIILYKSKIIEHTGP